MQDMSLINHDARLNALINASPLEAVKHDLLDACGLHLFIKRDDLLHQDISGNKWRKLKYKLRYVVQHKKRYLLSFGGAYSNHIHALAAARFHLGFKSSAIIRGEAKYAANSTLQQAQKWGITLHFISRQEYRLRHQPSYLKNLQEDFPDAFIIPEGGSNHLALPGG